MITFLRLRDNLKSAVLPAFCLFGHDRWLQLKSVAAICEIYDIADDGFGVERLDAPTYNQIELACCTPSFFSPKKLVLVENFQFPQGKQQQELAKKIAHLISQCDGSFCVAFISETCSVYEKIDGITVVNCEHLDNESVAKWIVAYAKRQKTEISLQCARKIGEYCLQDMSRVASETQKLIDYGEISAESIESLVHKDTEYQIFNLSKTISEKNTKYAVEMYKGLIAAGEEARGVFGLLYNTYRRAYYVKTSGFTNDEMAQYLAVKPFAVEKAKELSAKYKPMQLKRILDFFDAADIKLKAFLDETEVMTTLIMQIASV